MAAGKKGPERRDWGSGTVYETPHGWRVALSLGTDPFGKRLRKEWQFRSEASARELLAQHERRRGRGLPIEESRVTVAAYVPSWLDTLTDVRPSTASYYRAMARHVTDTLGHLRVSRLEPTDVRALIAKRQSEKYAARTILGILDVLRMVLRQAMADGIVDRNVVELVRRPRLVQKEPVHLTAEQVPLFLAAAPDELRSLFTVAIGTGLRRGELLALTWADVDMKKRVVTVREAKTRAGIRTVPLPAFAWAALGTLEQRPGPIWRIRPEYATRAVGAVCKRLGLPALTFHGLRHSTASILLAQDVPLEVIRSILGHSRAAMTMHYARPEEDMRRTAIETLDRALG